VTVRYLIWYAGLRTDAISTSSDFATPFASAMQIKWRNRTHLGMLQVRGTEPLIAAVRC